MSISYEALGDKLSNTDPISNSVLISGLDFRTDGAMLLIGGNYPIACLGSYIHESLHHMCFRSPVGSAIAHLYQRGFQRAADYAILDDRSSTFDSYHVLEDIVRVEAILHIMRPLAEGIALFGEFDAWPGNSKSISSVFRNTALAFAEVVPEWRKLSVDNVLRGVLSSGRSRQSARRRKENLLMQGFTTQNGGYLPGYFLVKNLQFVLFRQTKADLLLDSEFYLNFLIHWFYGDFDLVEAILTETGEMAPARKKSVRKKDSVNAIAVVFQKRMADLFRLTPDQFTRFDDLMVSAPSIPWWRLQIGRKPSEASAIETELLNAINSQNDYLDKEISDHQRGVRMICRSNFFRRNYLCLGSFIEQIEISTTGVVKLARGREDSDFPVMSFGNSERPGPFKGSATFDVMQSGFSEKIFFVVSTEGHRVMLQARGDDFEAERKTLFDVDLSSASAQHAQTLMRDMIDKAIDRDGGAAMTRDYYRREWEQLTEKAYASWCRFMMSVVGPEADIPPEQGAIFTLCDQDSKFLRTMATLGCFQRPFLDDEEVAAACEMNDLTVAQFTSRAETVLQKHNLRLLYKLGNLTGLTI